MDHLPVVVVGAGPIGLAAAAELVLRDQQVVVLEAGDHAGAGVCSWGHVRLFSPWAEVISPAALTVLARGGWSTPTPTRYPTGQDWVREYLVPLAAALGDRVRTGHRVVGVARRDRDLLVGAGRERQPFVVHVDTGTGRQRILARAVVDASGTLGTPNPLGGEGYPVPGEHDHRDRIRHTLPDPTRDEDRYAGRATAVVGSGASALTAVIALTSGPLHTPGSRVVWVLRRGSARRALGGGTDDELPARGALGLRVRAEVAAGRVDVVTGFRTVGVGTGAEAPLRLEAGDGRVVDSLDEVVVATGYRPDLSWLSEVRLDLDDTLRAPRALAPSIDPTWHSCGSVVPHGADVLRQPEGELYLVGTKSYGRAPSFLARTGFEQVRSIAAALAGDHEAARAVELVLPDTGVCRGAGVFDAEDPSTERGCCEKVPVGAGGR